MKVVQLGTHCADCTDNIRAPEYFQRRMSQILDSLEGAKCQMDDVIVYSSSQEDHDRNLVAALQRIADSKMTLNYDKCLFSKK